MKMVLLQSRQNEAIKENLRKSFTSNNPTSCPKQRDYTLLQEIQFPSSVLFFRASFLILKKIIFLFVAYEEKQRRIVYHSADWCRIVLKSSFA